MQQSPDLPNRRRHPAWAARRVAGAASAVAAVGLTGYLAVTNGSANSGSTVDAAGTTAASTPAAASESTTPSTPAAASESTTPTTAAPTTRVTTPMTVPSAASSARPALPSRSRSTFSRGS